MNSKYTHQSQKSKTVLVLLKFIAYYIFFTSFYIEIYIVYALLFLLFDLFARKSRLSIRAPCFQVGWPSYRGPAVALCRRARRRRPRRTRTMTTALSACPRRLCHPPTNQRTPSRAPNIQLIQVFAISHAFSSFSL